jgi:hypothetical protein
MAYTSIQIYPRTRRRLAGLREYRRETYDEVLNKLLDLVPSGDEEGEYTEEFRAKWVRGHLDLKHGRTVQFSEIKKKFGL